MAANDDSLEPSTRVLIHEMFAVLALVDLADDPIGRMLRGTTPGAVRVAALTANALYGPDRPNWFAVEAAIDQLADEAFVALEDNLGGAAVTLFFNKLAIAALTAARASALN